MVAAYISGTKWSGIGTRSMVRLLRGDRIKLGTHLRRIVFDVVSDIVVARVDHCLIHVEVFTRRCLSGSIGSEA